MWAQRVRIQIMYAGLRALSLGSFQMKDWLETKLNKTGQEEVRIRIFDSKEAAGTRGKKQDNLKLA